MEAIFTDKGILGRFDLFLKVEKITVIPHSALRNFCNFWIHATHRKSLFGVHLSLISAVNSLSFFEALFCLN